MDFSVLLSSIALLLGVLLLIESQFTDSSVKRTWGYIILSTAVLVYIGSDPVINLYDHTVNALGQRIATIKEEFAKSKKQRTTEIDRESLETEAAHQKPKDQGRLPKSFSETGVDAGTPRYVTIYARDEQIQDYATISAIHPEAAAALAAMELGQWKLAIEHAERFYGQKWKLPRDIADLAVIQMQEVRALALLETGKTADALQYLKQVKISLQKIRASQVLLDRTEINLAIAKTVAGESRMLDATLLIRLQRSQPDSLAELCLFFWARALQHQADGANEASALAKQESMRFQRQLLLRDPVFANRMAAILGLPHEELKPSFVSLRVPKRRVLKKSQSRINP